MDKFKDLEKIVKIVHRYEDIHEIEINDKEGLSIRVSKKNTALTTTAPVTTISTPAMPIADNNAPVVTTEPEKDDNGNIFKAPMVGTIYLSPSPDKPTFVSPGKKVSKGDTLCLIEAMKMFNKIKSDKTGTIKNVLIQDAQPVEYGQELFVIEE